ncbi:MAG: efflux RND transporter periplasmic adaptor subunit [Wenzhouxiangellaceae bacterium]|nr:efflux RND transporter periplasmic adaptor subunit [Wenzhouxiangellaceae bacterium]
MNRIVLLLAGAAMAGCSGEQAGPQNAPPRLVQTTEVRAADTRPAQLSGRIRSRFETPLAFEVGGRIVARSVDAGQRVEAGQLLFQLDPRDFEQSVRVARADVDAARAEWETAKAETRRNRELLEREFISAQIFERVELAEKAAHETLDAARARLEQAENSLGYATLSATRGGVLIEVSGEPGQVVSPGRAVGIQATDGDHEVEVFLPEALGVPSSGQLVGTVEGPVGLVLREVAGAADAATRTWRARYSIVSGGAGLRLGAVVKVALDVDESGRDVLEVPVAAINERGQGPQVWLIEDGRAEAVRVTLLDMNTEMARIVADLPAGARVISLGTHLLKPGMPVRELP